VHVATLHFDEDSPPSPAFRWEFAVTVGPAQWDAILGLGTPTHLVQALFAAVADPAPVRRRRHELPVDLEPHLKVARPPATALSRDAAVPPHPRITEPPPAHPPEGRRR
jgi:hypothetical protein